jgi:hypothetical protein
MKIELSETAESHKAGLCSYPGILVYINIAIKLVHKPNHRTGRSIQDGLNN